MDIELLRMRKKNLKLTTEKLAKLAGLPVGTVSKIMTGETKNPTVVTIEKIDNALSQVEMRRRVDKYKKLISGVGESISCEDTRLEYCTDEKELIELLGRMNAKERTELLRYAREMLQDEKGLECNDYAGGKNMVKIAEFCDVEVYIDSSFKGSPTVDINYLDDNVQGELDIMQGIIKGDFSKYVIPVIEAWYKDNKKLLRKMWESHKVEMIPAWE